MAAKAKRGPCPECRDTGVRSVTKTYHPITGQVIRRTENPCRSCT